MQFESPLAFLLVLIVLLVLIFHFMMKKYRIGEKFSSVGSATGLQPSFRQRLLRIPEIMNIIALILLVLAIARPRAGQEEVVEVNSGIAIEILVDRSSSMGAQFESNAESITRLRAAKESLSEFVFGNQKSLTGRENDLIGLITFSRYADTILPLTLSHGSLKGFLDTIVLSEQGSPEDGTAIGDAIALAAARLSTAEKDIANRLGDTKQDYSNDYEIESKIIILLTDGRNTAGNRTPLEAAELAKKWDITIYAIGIGDKKQGSLLGALFQSARIEVDEDMLSQLTSITGGIFRMANDEKALENIYREIDQLEKTEIKSIRYLN